MTIGLLLLINALVVYLWKPVGRGYPSPFPNDPGDYVSIGGARLRYTTIGTWTTLLVVLGTLWLILRFTKAGLAFRAVSSSRTNSGLMGVHTGRVLTGGWALAGAIGTLAGCLLASQLVLSPDMMVRLLVFGFAAATIGGLSSLGGALLGGLIVGVAQTMLGGYVPFVKGPLSLPVVLLLMVVMLAFRPHGLFGRKTPDKLEGDPLSVTVVEDRPPRWTLRRQSPAWRVLVGFMAALALVVVVAPPFVLPFVEANLWTRGVATVVVLWGLGLLMGPAGQLSLGHGAFVGLGGYATAVVISRYDWPPVMAVTVSALVGFVVGCLLGLPAIRIKGQYLAMVTLSFAVAFPMIIQRFSWFTGGSSGPPAGSGVRAPSWFPEGEDQAWLHVLITAAAVIVLVLLRNLLRGSVGRAIRSSAQGEVGATVMGVNVVQTRTIVFGLAAALAAIGGGMLAMNDRVVTTDQFDLFRSLALYTAIVFGGAELLSGAVVGAILLVAVPYVNARQGWKISPNLIFGLLVLAGTAAFPDGVTPTLARWARRVVRLVDADVTNDGAVIGAAGAGAAGAVRGDRRSGRRRRRHGRPRGRRQRTTRTGRGASCTRVVDTDPTRKRLNAPLSCEPTTMRSTSWSSAARQISLTTWPTATSCSSASSPASSTVCTACSSASASASLTSSGEATPAGATGNA